MRRRPRYKLGGWGFPALWEWQTWKSQRLTSSATRYRELHWWIAIGQAKRRAKEWTALFEDVAP